MIPKKIHYFWFGGNPKPKLVQKCIKSWKKYCPDYEIIEWNESNYDVTKIPYMEAAYDAKKWGFVTDYARLDIIYSYGGIYLDTDVQAIKSFDSLLEYGGFAGFESEKYVNTGLGIGAEPGHPIIKKLMGSYEDISLFAHNSQPEFVACPRIDTSVLVDIGLRQNGTKQILSDSFLILPTDYLSPKSFSDGMIHITENTISIHHFESSWFSQEKQKEKLARWRAAKWEYYRYAPNRFLLECLGKKKYEKIKNLLKFFYKAQ